eukprot:188166-Pelagomonas_calceolata.AAC.2
MEVPAQRAPRMLAPQQVLNASCTAAADNKQLNTAQCTVVADKLAALTTSQGAAGLWGPYKLSDTPEDQIMSEGANEQCWDPSKLPDTRGN